MLKVGDIVTREMDGFRGDEKPWRFEGRVTEITDDIITCVIFCDVPRTMDFDKETGINILGYEYGWLKM